MTDQEVINPVNVIDVGCPKCHAEPGERCKMLGGGLHTARLNFYNGVIGKPADELIGVGDAPEGVRRWQYAVANIGMFKSADHMTAMLANAGSHGWELAATMDKTVQLVRRDGEGLHAAEASGARRGVTPKQWCITVRG